MNASFFAISSSLATFPVKDLRKKNILPVCRFYEHFYQIILQNYAGALLILVEIPFGQIFFSYSTHARFGFIKSNVK